MATKELTRPRIHSGDSLAEQLYPQKRYEKQRYAHRMITKPSSNGDGALMPLQLAVPDLRVYVSEEEYWQTYYDCAYGNYEWNNGYLEEKPMASVIKFRMYVWFLELLKDYLHVHNMGLLTGLEIGFRMQLANNRVTIRKPDLGVVLRNNSVPLNDNDRTYQGIFDICIESVSDSTQAEIERDTIHKRDEYAQAGVPEYYILDDTGRETVFYTLASSGVYVPIQPVNGIIRSIAMPGFQFRLDDLYRGVRLPELAMDPVYSGYASPEYRAARRQAQEEYERAEEEHQRAEEERQRAEEEHQRAEEAEQQASIAIQRAEEEHQRASMAEQRASDAEQQASDAVQNAEEERLRAEKAEQQVAEERLRAEKAKLQAEEERQRISAQVAKWAELLRDAGIVPTDLENL